MRQTLDSEIRDCYLHAAECRRSADQSRDRAARQDFLEMEKRWLRLAGNYEFAEQLSNFSTPVEKSTGGLPSASSRCVGAKDPRLADCTP